jgi:phage terminase large subunit-like protein
MDFASPPKNPGDDPSTDTELAHALAQLEDEVGRNRLLEHYFKSPEMSATSGSPYPWQAEFHSKVAFGRMLMCPNRVGKTRCGAAEVAIHATGMYPPWWQGKRFSHAIDIAVGANTNENSRDITQRELIGGDKVLAGGGRNWGTGWVPLEKMIMKKETGEPAKRQCGIDNVVDYVDIEHVTGKTSRVTFKTYKQGREAWEGSGYDLVWMDEEPDDQSIFTEAMTRCADRGGVIYVTRTPLFGKTLIVSTFMEKKDGRDMWFKNVTWDDAPHLDEKTKKTLLATYPAHEIDARTRGIPMMGEGRVYPVSDDDVSCEPFIIPKHYARICGIDFGWDHPTAGAWLAWNRDADVVYVYDCFRESHKEPVYHANTIKSRSEWVPVAWPHDGLRGGSGGGPALSDQYRKHGVKMLPDSARYDPDKGGGQDTEPIVMETLDRMRTGRFKVFKNLGAWFEELRSYHRKNGKIVRVHDDLLSATHYGLMMLRCARTEAPKFQPRIQGAAYDPLSRYDRRPANVIPV